jgi:hypothetical protein
MNKIIEWFKNNKAIIIPTAVWLIIGIGLLCSYRLWNWKVIEAFATWILAAGIAVAIWQIIVTRTNNEKQLKESRKNSNAQLALGIYRELRSAESRKKLQAIYSEKPEYFTEFKYNSKVEDIDSILDSLGMIGTLIDHGILGEKLAIETFGGVTVIKCWYQLGGYIKKELRSKRGLQAGSYFEDFASRALEYWKKHGKSDSILFYHNEDDKPFDLVEKLDKDEKLRPRRLTEQDDLPIRESERDFELKEP